MPTYFCANPDFFARAGTRPEVASRASILFRSSGRRAVRKGVKATHGMLVAILCVFPVGSQSLAELARREAERRKALHDQGIAGKVIESHQVPANSSEGRLAVSDQTPAMSKSSPAKSPGSVAAYRNRLQSLDGQIRRTEEQARLLQARLAEERWAPPKVGKVGKGQKNPSSLEDVKWKIRELESNLGRLRKERLEIYERGRKAGFLPGELEGKGITP
jgi:hypothetical protein